MIKYNYTTTHSNLSTYKLSVQKVNVSEKLEAKAYKMLESKVFCPENGGITFLRNAGAYITTRCNI